MLNHPAYSKYDYGSIRGGIIAGAPCPTTLCAKLVNELGMKDLQVRSTLKASQKQRQTNFRCAMGRPRRARSRTCPSATTRRKSESATSATLWTISRWGEEGDPTLSVTHKRLVDRRRQRRQRRGARPERRTPRARLLGDAQLLGQRRGDEVDYLSRSMVSHRVSFPGEDCADNFTVTSA